MPNIVASLSPSLVDRILAQYGVQAKRYLQVQKGYRNQSYSFVDHQNRALNLIFYKDEQGMAARVQRANYVADFLHSNGLSSRYTVDSRIIKLKTSTGERFASLYAYLPGETIAWEAYTQKHLKQLGATMAQMHRTLKATNSPMPSVAQEYIQIVERMTRYLQTNDVQQALSQKLQLKVNFLPTKQWTQVLRACDLSPNQQILHMDFVRSNILFENHKNEPEISGIIDFEKTAYGIPAFDIARTLAFLLVDCKFKEPQKIRKYFLGSGYAKRGGGTLPSAHVQGKNIIDYLTDIFLLYDFYKFLKHNPYEFLEKNEHFIRTRDILAERGMLLYKARHTAITPEGTTP